MRCTGFEVAAFRIFGLLAFQLYAIQAFGGEIAPDLVRAMAHRGTHADTAVILHFVDPVDLKALAVGDRSKSDNRLFLALKKRAERNRASVELLLKEQEATKIKDLWMVNAVAATVPAISVKKLAAHPSVARVDLDSFVQGGRSQRTPRSRTQPGAEPGPSDPTTKDAASARPANIPGAKPEWNLVSVHVPEVWSLGQTGAGVVVASLDTGVDLSHPDLRRKWRGGTNSWYDPHGEEASPYDAVGHGTQSMGVIAGGPDFGIAPDVRWIAARLYNGEGKASLSDIHLAFQWLMDPDGDPDTRDAPDVVNASWALTGRGAGTCTLEFNDDIRALKSAGIAVVFAAGNDGPFPNTSNSPGNNPGVLSVGAIDRDMELARQTSRGPSACDGSIFPTLLAPGVNIRTADLSYGGTPSYTTVSGTSLAAPHAAGILALLAGAFPRATVDELEKALIAGSVLDKSNSTRRIDALGAYNVLLRDREFVTNGPAAQTVSR